MVHEVENGKCTTCNYESSTPPADPQDKTNKGLPWWVIVVVGAAALIGGFGGSVIVMKASRKK